MMIIQVRPRIISDSNDVKSAAVWSPNTQPLQLTQLLRPFLTVFAVTGCYPYEIDFGKNGTKTKRGRRYRLARSIYRYIWFLATVTYSVKYAAAFFTVSSTFMRFNLIIFAWSIICVLSFVISLKSRHSKYGHQRKAFKMWDETILPEIEELGMRFPTNKFRKKQTIYLFIVAFVTVFNTIGSSLLAADIFSDGFGAFAAAPFSSSAPAITLAMLLTTMVCFVWLMSVFYIIIMATLLTATFDMFNKFLETKITKNVRNLASIFPKIRLLHLNLSQMVSELDSDLGYTFAVIFVLNIGISCFILHQILKASVPTVQLVMLIFWMFTNLGSIAAVAIYAALVHESVSIRNKCRTIKHELCVFSLLSLSCLWSVHFLYYHFHIFDLCIFSTTTFISLICAFSLLSLSCLWSVHFLYYHFHRFDLCIFSTITFMSLVCPFSLLPLSYLWSVHFLYYRFHVFSLSIFFTITFMSLICAFSLLSLSCL